MYNDNVYCLVTVNAKDANMLLKIINQSIKNMYLYFVVLRSCSSWHLCVILKLVGLKM